MQAVEAKLAGPDAAIKSTSTAWPIKHPDRRSLDRCRWSRVRRDSREKKMKRGTNLWNITAQRWRLTQQGGGCSCSTCQPSHQTRYCHAFACMRVFNRCFLSPTFTTGWCFLSVSLLRSAGPSLATADLGFSWLFLLNTNFSLSEPIVRATAKEFKTVAKFPGNSPQQLVSVQPTTMEGWRKEENGKILCLPYMKETPVLLNKRHIISHLRRLTPCPRSDLSLLEVLW